MNLPNFLTFVRIVFAPVLFLTVFFGTPAWSLGLFLFLAATDALDGFAARALKQETRLGAFLDPIADKTLILAGFFGILFTEQLIHKPQLWIQILVLLRELTITIGSFTLFFFLKNPVVTPNILGKVTTLSQMLLIILCLAGWRGIGITSWLTASLTLASGFFYTYRGILQLSASEKRS